eukprot:4942613-Alexandrium_andersonii.AAC.1
MLSPNAAEPRVHQLRPLELRKLRQPVPRPHPRAPTDRRSSKLKFGGAWEPRVARLQLRRSAVGGHARGGLA